ncbi:hypothetical protein HNQ91_001340 [Filimonas zeae]|uniref:Uncharacterized protein n=1 Tax=Filimonas zeae TaxID=1737353 RepID=A0A917ITF1_9BACT|nr:DUF6702 family protein [Filimonas zeae]MDR6338318.1 hypothetical protein [Filimonas zeae]GGH62818.1 hypothetical protein GCM10011379_13120 [Filimonas zeae]
MAAIFYNCVLNAFFFFHPFFVSVTDLKQNTKDKTIEISSKLFIDDFEKALTAAGKAPVDLSHPADKEKTDQQIAGYFKQHFQLSVNGQKMPVSYIGYEKEGEAAWCYLQVTNAPAVIKRVDIVSDVLYKQFESQIHIFHVTAGKELKSSKITNPESRVGFDF